MERIDSPEKLNSMIKVSKLRIWIILFLLLIFIVFSFVWFVKKSVVIEERHPLYISDEMTTVRDLLYKLIYQDSNDAEITKEWTNETEKIYGTDYMDSNIYPACLFVKDLSSSEMVEHMDIKAAEYNGTILYLPFENFNYKNIFTNMEYTDEEMRKVGMIPGINYSPVIVAIWAKQDNMKVKSGLYDSSVILDVLKPISMITK